MNILRHFNINFGIFFNIHLAKAFSTTKKKSGSSCGISRGFICGNMFSAKFSTDFHADF
jgi:hypothetical protein